MSRIRRTRGRQRIPIRRIEHPNSLYTTFTKRRLGIYRKASELTMLCNVDIGIIVFSPTNIPYSFFHPSMISVVDRYRNPNQPPSDYARITSMHIRAGIEGLNGRFNEVQEMKQRLREQEKKLDDINKAQPDGWWEQTPVEDLSEDQVKDWLAWFENFHAQVHAGIQELQNGGSSSSTIQNVQNALDPSLLGSNAFPSQGQGPATAGGLGHVHGLAGTVPGRTRAGTKDPGPSHRKNIP